MVDAARFVWPDGAQLTFAEPIDAVGFPFMGWGWDPPLVTVLPSGTRPGRKTTEAAPAPGVQIEDVAEVGEKLRAFAAGVRHVAVEMYEALKPDEFALEVGITASSKAGILVANVEGGASMKATFTWKAGGPTGDSTTPA